MSLQIYISLAAFSLALGGNIIWAFVSYATAEKKKYAAERDFNHLKNNQKQMSDGIVHGFEEIERQFAIQNKELVEIKAWLIRNSRNKSED
jgi:hypothetical protein